MSILKKIAKLKELSKRIHLMQKVDHSELTHENLSMVENLFYEIVKNEPHKTGLSKHLHGNTAHLSPVKPSVQKTDVYFQFTDRLNSLLQDDFMSSQEIKLITPPLSPIKSAPPSPTKLKSPSKQPSLKFKLADDIEIEKNLNQLEEKSIAEARTAEYLSRILELDNKIQETIFELEVKVESNKAKMKKSFKTLMLENSLPYDNIYSDALLGELYDIVHRNEGTFEKLVKALSQSFADKLKEEKGNLFGHELLLMSELTEDQIPKASRKIYLGKNGNNHNLVFVLKTLKGNLVNGILEIDISKIVDTPDLAFEHLPLLKKHIISNITEKDEKRLFGEEIAKIIFQVRKNIIKSQPSLFTELGEVSAFPEAYFTLNELSKTLAQNFIKALYASPVRVKIMMAFQQEKEKTIQLELIDKILSRMPELYNLDILYYDNLENNEREYIQSINDMEVISEIKIVTWEEISNEIQDQLENPNYRRNELTLNSINNILNATKKTYDEILNTFNAISVISEQNSCISFFPIKLESQMNPMPQHICLVTTSGDTEKLTNINEQNKAALIDFQQMIKNFAMKYEQQQIEGIPFSFVYHDQKQGSIDVLLQQLNKGFFGHTQPLLSFSPDNDSILSDPFRGCAEKKFIAYVRDTLNNPDQTSALKILGAANLRMPIIPRPEWQPILNKYLSEIYTDILTFVNNDLENQSFYESACFKQYLNNSLKIKEIVALKKENPKLFKKWKSFHSEFLVDIHKDYECVITQNFNQVYENMLLNFNKLKLEGPNDEQYTEVMNELFKQMCAFIKRQEQIALFKSNLDIKAKSFLDRLMQLAPNLGATFKSIQESNKVILSKINNKGGLKRISTQVLSELNVNLIQKYQIIKATHIHQLLWVNFYTDIIGFLSKRKSIQAINADLLIEQLKSFNLVLEKNHMSLNKNCFSFSEDKIKELLADVSSKVAGVSLAVSQLDLPDKPAFTTDKLLERFSKNLTVIIKSLEIPMKFSFLLNYGEDEFAELETNFIDCCVACQANKLPVLTWLTDLQLASQKKHKECSANPLLFSSCFHSPQRSLPENNTTTLSPVMRSLNLTNVSVDDGLDDETIDTDRLSNPNVRKKLFS